MLKVEYFSTKRKIPLSSRTCKLNFPPWIHLIVKSHNCPHCLTPTSRKQAGNKRQDRHTNRAPSSRRHPQYAAKKKLLPLLMSGVTFQCTTKCVKTNLPQHHFHLVRMTFALRSLHLGTSSASQRMNRQENGRCYFRFRPPLITDAAFPVAWHALNLKWKSIKTCFSG